VGGTARGGTFRIKTRMEYGQVTGDTTNGNYRVDSDGFYALNPATPPPLWAASAERQDKGYLRAGVSISAITVSQTFAGATPTTDVGLTLDKTDPTLFTVNFEVKDTSAGISALSNREVTHFEAAPAAWALGSTDGGANTTKSTEMHKTTPFFAWDPHVTFTSL